MSAYGWRIDSGPEHSGSAVIGPRDIPDDLEAALDAGKGEAFKMYDDDGEHYYSGRIVGDYDGFEPLDDYGTPNAGATEIRYRARSRGPGSTGGGAWETL